MNHGTNAPKLPYFTRNGGHVMGTVMGTDHGLSVILA